MIYSSDLKRKQEDVISSIELPVAVCLYLVSGVSTFTMLGYRAAERTAATTLLFSLYCEYTITSDLEVQIIPTQQEPCCSHCTASTQ